MFNCLWLVPSICLVPLLVNAEGEYTAANYLYNVDVIITRQLQNPVEEDAEYLKDNVEEYVTVLGDLLQSVSKRDHIGLATAKQYWNKGIPQFFNEERKGDIFTMLMTEFNWPNKVAKDLTKLIDRARALWFTFDTWYKENIVLLNRF